MNYFQDSYSELSSMQHSLQSPSNQSMTTPPLSSTPTPTPALTVVPPLRPKKVLSLSAEEFVPTTPQKFKNHGSLSSGNDCGSANAVNRQRVGYVGAYSGGSTIPLNMHSMQCNFSQNPFLRQQQILHEKQKLLHKQQELDAAAICKQQLVLSAATAANYPQDEIANSLKAFAALSKQKATETLPSSEEVMQDFAANGYTTDELNRYQQYQAAASNAYMCANSLAFRNSQYNHNFDYNSNANNSNFDWIYQQNIQESINAYNELLRQNFWQVLPLQLIRQAETVAAANAAANMSLHYNNQNLRPPKRNFVKKESQVATRRCVFCENNNEPEEVVRSHAVRDSHGRVLCPKLRIYVCPICGASGDDAHTVKYCPQKPVVTMEDTLKAESIRYFKTNYAQKSSQMQV